MCYELIQNKDWHSCINVAMCACLQGHFPYKSNGTCQSGVPVAIAELRGRRRQEGRAVRRRRRRRRRLPQLVPQRGQVLQSPAVQQGGETSDEILYNCNSWSTGKCVLLRPFNLMLSRRLAGNFYHELNHSHLLTDSISRDSWLNWKRGTAMAAAVPAPLLGRLPLPLLLSLSLFTPLSDGEADDACRRGTAKTSPPSCLDVT